MRNQVEVRLLGPLDVQVEGRPVAIRSPKCRILLATLLAEPGRVVSVSELADAVWDKDKPHNPRRTLQVYVTRVRTILLSAGAPTLISTGMDGYRADVAAECVDLKQFQALLAQADRAADASDPDNERAALTRAVGLWRGEPFADVPSDYLHGVYGHLLTEQRLKALERRLDLALRQGGHAEAVDELMTLTTQHPLRERLWIQLITALHRSGRRTAALQQYDLMRRTLSDELGVEPDRELRHLQALILRGSADAPGNQPMLPPTPRQIPPDVIGFSGRAAEIEEMCRLSAERRRQTDRPAILLVTGMAGVGKTALAVHWSRRVADLFPDGQLWINLRGYHNGAVAPEQALAYALRALGIPGEDLPTGDDRRIELYRSAMTGRRMLVVLDNAGSVEQVRPLLPNDTSSLVLVTSRNQLADLVEAEGAKPVPLDPFTDEDARHLIASRLGKPRVEADPDAVDRIIDKCGGLPLALAVVAARAVTRPDTTLTALAKHQILWSEPQRAVPYADRPAAGHEPR